MQTVNTLTKLKANHKVKYGQDFPKRKLTDLESYANVDDVTLKRAPKTTLEGVANDLILEAERAEQERIKANPPVYSREYVERSDYTITSLYSDYKDDIEQGLRTWDEYKEERKKWRRCKHKFCLNVFPIDSDNFKDYPAKRIDSRYCCDSCRYLAAESNTRYEQTGSYLPQWFYLPALSESVGDRVRRNDFASESADIEREINKNRPIFKAKERDRMREPSPVKTYYLSEDEIAERKLRKLLVKVPTIRGDHPYISEKVGERAGGFSTVYF